MVWVRTRARFGGKWRKSIHACIYPSIPSYAPPTPSLLRQPAYPHVHRNLGVESLLWSEEHVLWFHVAMNHPAVVNEPYPAQHLEGDLHDSIGRHSAGSSEGHEKECMGELVGG